MEMTNAYGVTEKELVKLIKRALKKPKYEEKVVRIGIDAIPYLNHYIARGTESEYRVAFRMRQEICKQVISAFFG